MLGELEGYRVWDEPGVGRLFGEFYGQTPRSTRAQRGFIMGDSTRERWVRSVRAFVLEGADYANPGADPRGQLVVKEPGGGSLGAPLLMEALPESRMVFMVRDPRDAMASVLDSAREGNWAYQRQDPEQRNPNAPADSKPAAYLKRRSQLYVRQVQRAREAYEAHGGRKSMVRYEDLRADTLPTVRRILSELGLPAAEGELARAVEKHAWENIPESEKGQGKFNRKAKPGGWREDLTPHQANVVEEVTAPILAAYYGGV